MSSRNPFCFCKGSSSTFCFSCCQVLSRALSSLGHQINFGHHFWVPIKIQQLNRCPHFTIVLVDQVLSPSIARCPVHHTNDRCSLLSFCYNFDLKKGMQATPLSILPCWSRIMPLYLFWRQQKYKTKQKSKNRTEMKRTFCLYRFRQCQY